MSADDDFFGSLPPSERWRLPEPADWEPGAATRWIAPPPEAFIPVDDPRYLQLGWGRTPEGQWRPVGIRHDELRFGAWISGPLCSGKSEALKKLLRQFITARIGCLALDGKGMDLADHALPLIPREREGEVVVFDLEGLEVNGEHLVPTLNLCSRSLGLSPEAQAEVVLDLFVTLHPTFDLAYVNLTRLALRALFDGEQAPTFWHLQRFLSNEAYRRQVCQAVSNETVRDFWLERLPGVLAVDRSPLSTLQQSVERVLSAPSLSALLLAPSCSLPLRELMDTGGIVLGGTNWRPEEAGRVGSVSLLLQALLVAQSRATAAGAEDAEGFCPTRPDFHLVIDEAAFLLRGVDWSMRAFLSLPEELRLGVVLVSQGRHQFAVSLHDDLRKVPYRVMLGATLGDAEVWAREDAALGLLPSDFSHQEQHQHQRVRLREQSTSFSARPLGQATPCEEPAPEPVEQDWRTISAPAQREEDRLLDEAIRHVRELAAQSPEEAIQHLGQIARTDPARFTRYSERTRAHRQAQRAFILRNPGAIPNQYERIRTVSALWMGVPLLEVRAYQWGLANPSTVREG